MNHGNLELLISYNPIYGNGRDGVTFIDAPKGSYYVINNTIHDNGWNGIWVAREHSLYAVWLMTEECSAIE